MKYIFSFIFILLLVSNSFAQETRDPYKWPFSRTSIWNMPIGSNAKYVHARLERTEARGMTVDEDIIVLTPNDKLMDIYSSSAAWNRSKSRCTIDGDFMFSAPIPINFIVSPDTWDGVTPNSGLAVLMPDGRTIRQTQPFAHCEATNKATSKYNFPDQDLFGECTSGAHGGSGLSSIGGALRVGELTPASGPIRHVLKINVWGRKNLYYDEVTKGFRWPASRADASAPTPTGYSSLRKSPSSEACRMGSLLALPSWMKLDSLGFETEPARILAKTFQDYGAYIVDGTGWDVWAIITEWSPSGRFIDEFKKNWGFPIIESNKDSPWGRDMDRIFLNLYVVDNNGQNSIGGGGVPRMPLAPDFPKN